MNQYIPVSIFEKDRESRLECTEDRLNGSSVKHKTTRISDLSSIFGDEKERALIPSGTIVYEVDVWEPVSPGTPGGLFFGVTRIKSGQVGDEYFMTRGHFHAKPDRAEFYWGIKGGGVLILMDRNRNISIESMYPGSLHYIPGYTAHRVANTGDDILAFGASWPADAGYNYEEIEKKGFAGRLMNVNGSPQLKLEK